MYNDYHLHLLIFRLQGFPYILGQAHCVFYWLYNTLELMQDAEFDSVRWPVQTQAAMHAIENLKFTLSTVTKVILCHRQPCPCHYRDSDK